MPANLDEILRQLSSSAEAFRALLHGVSDEQARWKPDAETWSLHEVMEHVYNEERLDFRAHLDDMLADPPRPWKDHGDGAWSPVAGLGEGLEGFLREREASLAWLRGLGPVDWDRGTQLEWGTLRAGDVLVSWAEHDYLHLRQVIALLHDWNARQSEPYKVRYAGEW